MIRIDKRDLICTMRQGIEQLLAKDAPTDTDIGMAIEDVVLCGDPIGSPAHCGGCNECQGGEAELESEALGIFNEQFIPLPSGALHGSPCECLLNKSTCVAVPLDARKTPVVQTAPMDRPLAPDSAPVLTVPNSEDWRRLILAANRLEANALSLGFELCHKGLLRRLESLKFDPAPYRAELETCDQARKLAIIVDHAYRAAWNDGIDHVMRLIAGELAKDAPPDKIVQEQKP